MAQHNLNLQYIPTIPFDGTVKYFVHPKKVLISHFERKH